MLPVTQSKGPINQFKLVEQSRQQVQGAYCPNIYSVNPKKKACIEFLSITTAGPGDGVNVPKKMLNKS